MQTFLHSVSSVAVILLLTATGYLAARMGWMTEQTKAFISRFLMSFVIPVNCIYGLRNNLSREMLSGSFAILLVTFFGTVLNLALSVLLARLFAVRRSRKPLFIMMCALSNSLFIGYGMCFELFGEPCIPYVMMYFLVNTTFLQVVCMPLVRYMASGERFSGQVVLKILRMPTVLGVFIGFLTVLLEVQFPSLLNSYMKYISDLVSPMAMLLTGYIIWQTGFKNLMPDRDLAIVLLMRFVFSPVTNTLLCRAFGIDGLAKSVLLVEAAMPVVSQSVVAAAEYRLDDQFAAKGAALSTLLSFIEIPILMVLL